MNTGWLEPGERCALTSSRNFEGCYGQGGEPIWLARKWLLKLQGILSISGSFNQTTGVRYEEVVYISVIRRRISPAWMQHMAWLRQRHGKGWRKNTEVAQ